MGISSKLSGESGAGVFDGAFDGASFLAVALFTGPPACGFIPPFTAANTSPFTIIPRGPVPCICEASRPLSESSFFTAGPNLLGAGAGGAAVEDDWLVAPSACGAGASGAADAPL